MKIRCLRFKNLNSLVGEWSIDFTAAEYEAEGIFAITGPTGSGKTTILDAICLALYGQTPRLGKITGGGNEIMSRQTAECFAELTFSTVKGDFLVNWSQRRSRNKAEGKLQGAKHEISETGGEDGDWKVIESMVSKVPKVVEECCGMDFERFTRSSMLAQGNFAKFLESNASERAPILEQITGTGIYSELSILVHGRKVSEDAKSKTLKDQLDGATLLSEEEREKIEGERMIAGDGFEKVKKELGGLRDVEKWMEACEREAKILSDTEGLIGEHAGRVLAFSEQGKVLVWGRRALAITPEYRGLVRLRGDEKRDRLNLEVVAEGIDKKEEESKECLARSEECGLAVVRAKRDFTVAEPRIEEARRLIHGLEEKGRQLRRAGENLAEIVGVIARGKGELVRLGEMLKEGAEVQEASVIFLRDNAVLAELGEAFSGLESGIRRWSDDARVAKSECLVLADLSEVISELKVEAGKLKGRFVFASEEIGVEEGELKRREKGLGELLGGRLVGEVEALLVKRERQLDLERKIVKLSDERAKLVGGEACPLCGAEEHPFSEGASVAEKHVSATEAEVFGLKKLLKDYQAEERGITEASVKLERGRAGVIVLGEKEKALVGKISVEEGRYGVLAAEGKAVELRLAGVRDGILESLGRFGFSEVELGGVGAVDLILRGLEKRRDEWVFHSDKSRLWSGEKRVLEQRVSDGERLLNERLVNKEKVDEVIKALVVEVSDCKEKLGGILGEVSLQDFRAKFEGEIDGAERLFKVANERREDAEKHLAAGRSQKAEMERGLAEVMRRRVEQDSNFLKALAGKEFSDEGAYVAACLEEEFFVELSGKSEALGVTGAELKAKESQTRGRLNELRERELSERPLGELREEILRLSESYEERSKVLGGLQEQLRQDSEAREKLAEKRGLLVKQEKECARWANLHGLIGSSDGKKFRNFAQGLTFELMVRHANRQLAKMNERYQLLRSVEEPLELEVVDSYQAGEVRSTKNLSGGESFIVSLALALGLSKMASERVGVDSLFLDEGFGTLDEEALDTALGALASLNSEGKLIGLISHVPALKERISTQLTLGSGRNGRSVLSGPGVVG